MIKTFTNRLLKQFSRIYGVTNCSYSLSVTECLKNKSIISVSGVDAKEFLQGHLTNDINLFNNQCKSIYSTILNHQGRVLYDIFLYSKTDSYYIECDKGISADLIKHLLKYKLRKKINILLEESISICVSFLRNLNLGNSNETLIKEPIISSEDPRLPNLCKRYLINEAELLKLEENYGLYDQLRYKNGIGEGPSDFLIANCFPLESNLDFLNGVSFDKGCYVGQELTARTHHTGVIRKRLMPLVLKEPIEITPGANIENEEGKSIGKARNFCGVYGLGLLRVAEAMKSKKILIKNNDDVIVDATTHIPDWWLSSSDEIVKLTLLNLKKT